MLVPLFFAFQSLVAGETCPAAVDVEARVRTILHLPPEQELSEGFIVERHESGLYVELRSADAAVIGQRTLPAEGSCDELAQAAAVVLSAWLSDVHPDFAGALPAPEPARETEPVAAPFLEPTPQPAPAAPPPKPPPPPPPSSPPPPPRRFELGLAAGAELAKTQVAVVSGIVVVDYAPPARGWGLTGFAAAAWPRQLPLGPGSVAWRRWPIGIGPSFRAVTGAVRWEAGAGVALGWLHFSPSNLDHASSQGGFDGGGFLHLRAANRGRAGVFAQADARFFPGDSGASATYRGGRWLAPVPGLSGGLVAGAWFSL
ncbi:MAG: hypothetical protein ABUL60_15730 [Myxococcales bacterium]